MKKTACAAVVIVAVVGSLGAMFISQDQAIVSGVLNSLKLEPVPQKDPKIVGRPAAVQGDQGDDSTTCRNYRRTAR